MCKYHLSFSSNSISLSLQDELVGIIPIFIKILALFNVLLLHYFQLFCADCINTVSHLPQIVYLYILSESLKKVSFFGGGVGGGGGGEGWLASLVCNAVS